MSAGSERPAASVACEATWSDELPNLALTPTAIRKPPKKNWPVTGARSSVADNAASVRVEKTRAYAAQGATVLRPGSFVIERYTYERKRGGVGVQWCVHRVERDYSLSQIYVADTRRQAAAWIEGL